MDDFDAMKNIPLDQINRDNLIDIQSITVDKTLTKEERIADFIRQIGNPYCFKCGKFIVKARYADNGPSLEECLQSILL